MKLLKTYPDVDICAYRTGKGSLTDPVEGITEYFSLSSALQSKPDAVIISNPTSLHIPTALKVAQAGFPMLIEKPVSHNMKEVEKLRNLCDENDIPVLIGGYLPYHPAVILLTDMLNKGRLGTPICMRSHFGSYLPNWHPWEDYRNSYSCRIDLGGGVVLTSIHEISFALSLFGSAIDIKATNIPLGTLNTDIEQGVEILISHQSKVVSSIHLDFFQKPDSRYCEIICSEGTFYWDFWKPEIVIKSADVIETITLKKTPKDLILECYERQTEHFLNMITKGVEPKTPLVKGITDLKVALAILEQITH